MIDVTLIQKWLEEGERIETCYLDVFKKNQANDGMTDGSEYFRKLYYHFNELDDVQINEYTKILSRFVRSKASGNTGKEVVKNFLGDCLALLINVEKRQATKQYLDKNGIMPVDNSEEQRHHEEEHLRRQQEEVIRRRNEEEERRRKAEEQRRKNDDDRRRREEARKQKAEESRREAERYEQDIDLYTTTREQYVVNKIKSKKINIPWRGALKTIFVLVMICLFFYLIGSVKACMSSKPSSPLTINRVSNMSNNENTSFADNPIAQNETDDDQDFGSPDEGLYGSLPVGTTTFVGTMNGFPIEISITKSNEGSLIGVYKNVNYNATMRLTGESLPAQAGDISFYGKVKDQDWNFDLTGDFEHITGTAYGDNKKFDIDLRRNPEKIELSEEANSKVEPSSIFIVDYKPTPRAKACKLIKVVISSHETKLYGVYEGSGTTVWWKRTAYLVVNGDNRLMIKNSQGIPMEPNSCYVSSGEKIEFVLVFPALPSGTTQFDFIESDDVDSWRFYDIRLSKAI